MHHGSKERIPPPADFGLRSRLALPLKATFSIPEGIQKVAQAQRISPEKLIENVSGKAGAYQKSNKIAGRVDFMKSLKEAAMELFALGGLVVCLFEWHRRYNSRCHLSLVRL